MKDIRKSPDYQRWRQEVRQRDKNTCRVCGVHHNLHIHHIKPLDKYPEFAIELDNGLTLCGNCHSLLNSKEESTNLQGFIKKYPYPRDERIIESLKTRLDKQLKALNEKLLGYLRWQLESSDEYKRNDAVDKLFRQLQTYPDSLDQFLYHIKEILDSRNFSHENKRRAAEFLEGSSSWEASYALYQYKKQLTVLKRDKARKLRQEAEERYQQAIKESDQLMQEVEVEEKLLLQMAEDSEIPFSHIARREKRRAQKTVEKYDNSAELQITKVNRHPLNQRILEIVKNDKTLDPEDSIWIDEESRVPYILQLMWGVILSKHLPHNQAKEHGTIVDYVAFLMCGEVLAAEMDELYDQGLNPQAQQETFEYVTKGPVGAPHLIHRASHGYRIVFEYMPKKACGRENELATVKELHAYRLRSESSSTYLNNPMTVKDLEGNWTAMDLGLELMNMLILRLDAAVETERGSGWPKIIVKDEQRGKHWALALL